MRWRNVPRSVGGWVRALGERSRPMNKRPNPLPRHPSSRGAICPQAPPHQPYSQQPHSHPKQTNQQHMPKEPSMPHAPCIFSFLTLPKDALSHGGISFIVTPKTIATLYQSHCKLSNPRWQRAPSLCLQPSLLQTPQRIHTMTKWASTHTP